MSSVAWLLLLLLVALLGGGTGYVIARRHGRSLPPFAAPDTTPVPAPIQPPVATTNIPTATPPPDSAPSSGSANPTPRADGFPSMPPLVNAVADQLDDGLIVLDDAQQVRFLNQQATRLLRINPDDAAGKALITVLRDYQTDALVSDVQRDGEPREIEIAIDNGRRRVRVRCSPLHGVTHAATLVLLHDVTQLGNLERARRDLVANVSHELRNPLASVKLLVETLQTNPPPDVTGRMLGQMAQEVDAITQLVDELHELSQIESGRVLLQLQPVGIEPLVTRAIERITPQAERKSQLLSTEFSPNLPLALVDPVRIAQVLLNLLHNAVKFTPEFGSITVRVGVLRAASGSRNGHVEWNGTDAEMIELPQALAAEQWLVVAVTDTGIGIPSRELPRIFERFYKVDRARTRNAGGTGLGLAIAKHLIEGHGGRIWASSRDGNGSTFYVTLPVA